MIDKQFIDVLPSAIQLSGARVQRIRPSVFDHFIHSTDGGEKWPQAPANFERGHPPDCCFGNQPEKMQALAFSIARNP